VKKHATVLAIAGLATMAIVAATLAACGPTEPDPAPRVTSVAPEGEGIAPDAPGISVRFSEPVEPSGIEDGRFLALATEADAKSAATAAGSATGIGPGVAVVPSRVVLGEGGAEAQVVPEAPLQPLGAYAVVVGTGIRSVSGRAVMDPTGRKRAFATTFRTGPMPDRLPPVARWIAPPHGPAPSNLREIRIGFSEAVTGSLTVNGVAGRSRTISPDVLALTLDGPLPPGPFAPALDGIRDAGGNRPPPLPAIVAASCRDDRAPEVAAASVRVLPADTAISLAADASEMTRLGIEVAVERLGEGCGSLPDVPGSLVAWGEFAPCPGHDPCGAATRCPVSATATGLCPGRRVKVRLLAEDLAGNAAGPGPWMIAATGSAAARPVVTEVLADAATPQAGGEFVEIANMGSGEADLTGWKLAKRSGSGAVSRCTLEPKGGAIPPGSHGLVVGGGWDGRYPLPAGLPLFQCGATSLAGGLADDRAPAIALESPAGAVVSGFGWAAPSLRCTGRSVERILPEGEDATSNFTCAGAAPGTPGACNGSTPPESCPRRPF
jgi:hypothetical protein